MLFETGIDLLRVQGDVAWAGAEFTAKIFSGPYLRMAARKGDGHMPVMTLPGFTGPEISLRPLNTFLNANGYVANTWGLGFNRGVRDMEHMESIVSLLETNVQIMAGKHERKVALVGHSLGGVFARELARRHPDLIDRVITLGSPTYFGEGTKGVNAMVARLMSFYTGRAMSELLEEVEALNFDMSEPPADVPLVSIYSRYDGIAPQSTTKIPLHYLNDVNDAPRENIEIVCSHCGMGVNPLVLMAIADRLAEDRGNWVPFDPVKYSMGPARLASRLFYRPSQKPQAA